MAYYGQNKYRGIALVIGNERFDTKGKQDNIDRHGCVEDLKMMKQMFERLDFFVLCYKDLTQKMMEQKIQEASKHPRNEDCECFVLVLSTHGEERLDVKKGLWHHGVMGTDRELVMVEDILEMFDKKNATGLAGNPKLFFIQACRRKALPPNVFSDPIDAGVHLPKKSKPSISYTEQRLSELYDDGSFSGCEDLYKGWDEDVTECWSPTENKHSGTQETGGGASGGDASRDTGGTADSNTLPPDSVNVLSIKCPEDCLLYHPVVSGKFAFRTEDNTGSFMMKYLWEQFPKLLRGYSLDQYLTYVNRAMADQIVILDKIEKCRMTASILHRMTKHVKFVPKSNDSMMAKAVKIIENH